MMKELSEPVLGKASAKGGFPRRNLSPGRGLILGTSRKQAAEAVPCARNRKKQTGKSPRPVSFKKPINSVPTKEKRREAEPFERKPVRYGDPGRDRVSFIKVPAQRKGSHVAVGGRPSSGKIIPTGGLGCLQRRKGGDFDVPRGKKRHEKGGVTLIARKKEIKIHGKKKTIV